ncbi:hypothetical protein D3C73_1584240 [compost metagenome]
MQPVDLQVQSELEYPPQTTVCLLFQIRRQTFLLLAEWYAEYEALALALHPSTVHED